MKPHADPGRDQPQSCWQPVLARPVILWLLLNSLATVGCLPQDPEGTLQRVRGGVLRVGVTHNPPWTQLTRGAEPAGPDVELVQRLAADLAARIEWRTGGEDTLVPALEAFQLDLVIGGISASTPWQGRVGITRPYVGNDDEPRVLLCPPGENAWTLHLDRWLRNHAQPDAKEGPP